jgi:hypothetical protein
MLGLPLLVIFGQQLVNIRFVFSPPVVQVNRVLYLRSTLLHTTIPVWTYWMPRIGSTPASTSSMVENNRLISAKIV